MSDQDIAESIKEAIYYRQKDDTHISMSSSVIGGVRHIIFTSMGNADFRESYNFMTFIDDVLGRDKREYEKGRPSWANQHFVDDWLAIKPFVMDAVDKDDKIPIILSGHGVGGSIALIAGYHLMMKGKNLFRVVTFGAPRALNHKRKFNDFFIALGTITKQYALKKDPLPKMFRWTKYCSANRIVIDSNSEFFSIDDYVDELWMVDSCFKSETCKTQNRQPRGIK